MHEYSKECQVRVYIVEDEILLREVFCYEIESMCIEERSVSEWLNEYLDDVDAPAYRELLKTREKNFQAIFKCKMCHWYSYDNEYHEALELVGEPIIAVIPDDYLELMKTYGSEE